MAEHASFLIYKDNRALIDTCSDEQAGQLFKALFAFACDGEELQTDDRLVQGFYTVFRNSIERDDRKYQERCRKNAANGAKGGRPKKQNEASASGCNQSVSIACESNRSQAKKADSDTDSDSDTDTDSDSECGRGVGGTIPIPMNPEQRYLMDVFTQKRQSWMNNK